MSDPTLIAAPDDPAYLEHQAPLDHKLIYSEPGGWPLTGQEFIRLTTVSSIAATIVLIARTVNQRGEAKKHILTFANTGGRTVQTGLLNPGDGFLVSVTARAQSGTPLIGQTYALVELVVGQVGELQRVISLCGGIVTATLPIFAPGGGLAGPAEGAGALNSITGTTPGAGAEISETVATGTRRELKGLAFQIVTSAAVANRAVAVTFDDGANVFTGTAWNALITASSTVRFRGLPGMTTPWADQGGNAYIPIPAGLQMGAGFRFRTLTTNLQAGDQYSALQYLVREVLEF